MLKTHDVITADDLAAMRSGVAISFLWSETKVPPFINPAICDRTCEADARAAAGMASSPDSEWQAQFEAARLDLAADKEWRTAYIDGLEKAHQYCVFRSQERNAVPTGDTEAGGERWQYVGDINRTLGQGMDRAAARIQLAIQQAQRIDSVRAAMMEVLAERALNQCSSPTRR